MLDWLAAGLGLLLVVAVALWQCYRWQRKQDAVRVVNAIRDENLPELWLLLAERADLESVAEWFGDPPLILAVKSPATGFTGEAVKLLLRYGAKVDQRGVEWKTALMHAAALGDWKLCETLLHHGADPSARDMLGRTAAWWAERRGHGRIVALLRR